MMNADKVLELWGASKLPKTVQVYDYFSSYTPTEATIVSVRNDTVSVNFEYSEGYACCGGSDPDCYCSHAEPPYSNIEIRGIGIDEEGREHLLYHTIDASGIDLYDIVKELLEIANHDW